MQTQQVLVVLIKIKRMAFYVQEMRVAIIW